MGFKTGRSNESSMIIDDSDAQSIETIERFRVMDLRRRSPLRVLRSAKQEVQRTKGLELWAACRSGNLEYVKLTIKNFEHLIHLEQTGRTPLYFACRYGHPKITKVLLQAGATDSDGSAYKATSNERCRQLLREYQLIEATLNHTGHGDSLDHLQKPTENLQDQNRPATTSEQREQPEPDAVSTDVDTSADTSGLNTSTETEDTPTTQGTNKSREPESPVVVVETEQSNNTSDTTDDSSLPTLQPDPQLDESIEYSEETYLTVKPHRGFRVCVPSLKFWKKTSYDDSIVTGESTPKATNRRKLRLFKKSPTSPPCIQRNFDQAMFVGNLDSVSKRLEDDMQDLSVIQSSESMEQDVLPKESATVVATPMRSQDDVLDVSPKQASPPVVKDSPVPLVIKESPRNEASGLPEPQEETPPPAQAAALNESTDTESSFIVEEADDALSVVRNRVCCGAF